MEFENGWFLSYFSRKERKVIAENHSCSLSEIEDLADELNHLVQLAMNNSCLSFDLSEHKKFANAVATFIFADDSGWERFCNESIKLFSAAKNTQE